MIEKLLKEAGLTKEEVSGPRTALISGSKYGCSQVFEIHRRLRKHGPRGIDAVRFAQATHNFPVSTCAIEYGLMGPCLAIVSTETAGMDALLCAHDWITDDRCDRAIVVGFEDFSSPTGEHVCAQAKDAPSGQSVSEAMVMVLLERQSCAKARGVSSEMPQITGMATTHVNAAATDAARVRAKLACPTATHEQISFLTTHRLGLCGEEGNDTDYLGAGGLLEIAHLLKSPNAGQRGQQHWQISAMSQGGNGVTAGIKVTQMEYAL
ncbi:beta-ketoacyl synthase N-terminal-like domain-containing protein [Litoreibacter janthinus]|nr:beta-ketoacyl synthase N-terminal-like domain-containing protein [Litoreibacter janthinus]